MNRTASLLFLLVVVVQAVGLITFAAVRQTAMTQGLEVILQTVPVDPRSLFQGDYAILDYEVAEIPDHLGTLPVGAATFVILSDCGDVWCATDYTRIEPQPRDTYLRGVVTGNGRLDFGIGTYFVREGMGEVIEDAQDVKVVVALDSRGHAVIKRVLVDGDPLQPGGP